MEEEVIRQHRTEIVRCIKESTIVSLLETTLLTPDEAKQLRTECQQHSSMWVENLLDIVLESQSPGKWTSFQQALKKAKFPYLFSLVKQELHDVDRSYIDIIGIHRHELEKSLYADLPNIIVCLERNKVINMVDRQEIESLSKNKGDMHAAALMLDRMQCRLAPEQWYYSFCKVLLELDKKHVLQFLDPDFLANPSGFSSGKVLQETEMDVCEDDSSLKELVVTDYVEASTSRNDLSGAPGQSDTQYSSESSSLPPDVDDMEQKLSNIENNLCLLNIKPEMSKQVLEKDESLTSVKDENKSLTQVKTEEVKEEPPESDSEESNSNPFDSDYDDENEEEPMLFEPRNYQLELAEKAVAGQNTVVCAPTGVGKTWVALQLIHKHLQQDGERRVVFMARTGALIKQQADRIKKYLPMYQMKLLQGDTDNTQMLGEYMQDYQIFCFTPQILVNNLDNGSLKSLTQISLIILDECHHTKGDSPYSNLMRRYLVEKFDRKRDTKLPQIVGLTATLGVGKSSTDVDACDYILRICALLDVKQLSTVKKYKEDMSKDTSLPEEVTIEMQTLEDDRGREILKDAIYSTESTLEDMALLQPDLIDLMHEQCPPDKENQRYNQWTHEVAKVAQRCVDDYDMSRNIASCASFLNVYNQALEVNSLLRTVDVIKFLAERHRAESEQQSKLTVEEKKLLKNLQEVQHNLNKKARTQENPNIRLLSQTIRNMLETGGKDSRAMVFVKARATCKALAKFLDNDLHDIVRVSALYGKERRGNEEGMTQAVQDDTVEKFREGVYKVIVATSIGVEGIDIPDCNMALSYDYLGNEITKVQMRGRIRKRGGKNITMLHPKELDRERLSAYKETMMWRAMVMFENLRLTEIERKVALYQKEEMEKNRFSREVEMYKKRRKTDEGDYEIRCRKCNTLACYISDVRTIKVQHIVIDKTFVDRITTKPHKCPKTFDGFNKDRKMYCKRCPLDWGVVAIKNGLDCRILKLECFKLVNMVNREFQMYKKWIDVPYKIPEMEADDLERLLGDVTQTQQTKDDVQTLYSR